MMSRLVPDADGWCVGCLHRSSPNSNERPPGTRVDLVVIHGISLPPGEFGGTDIDHLFMNSLDVNAHASYASLAGLRVSAHALIRRDGALVQYVSFDRRAWHAGVSAWEGRTGCNDYSIGIELEGTDHVPYTDAQYVALIELVQGLQHRYPAITPERVVGHDQIAPGRKTDPGPLFDWARLRNGLMVLSESHPDRRR